MYCYIYIGHVDEIRYVSLRKSSEKNVYEKKQWEMYEKK